MCAQGVERNSDDFDALQSRLAGEQHPLRMRRSRSLFVVFPAQNIEWSWQDQLRLVDLSLIAHNYALHLLPDINLPIQSKGRLGEPALIDKSCRLEILSIEVLNDSSSDVRDRHGNSSDLSCQLTWWGCVTSVGKNGGRVCYGRALRVFGFP